MMTNLWERLAHIFGHKFTSQFGETPVDADGELTPTGETWATGLAKFSGEQIAAGLHRCLGEGDKWPTLPWFIGMCAKPAVNEFGLNYIPEVYRQRPQRDPKKLLSSDERNAKRLENRRQFIGAMRGVLGKSAPEPARIDPTREADRRDFAVMKAMAVLRSDHPSIVIRLSLAGYL